MLRVDKGEDALPKASQLSTVTRTTRSNEQTQPIVQKYWCPVTIIFDHD